MRPQKTMTTAFGMEYFGKSATSVRLVNQVDNYKDLFVSKGGRILIGFDPSQLEVEELVSIVQSVADQKGIPCIYTIHDNSEEAFVLDLAQQLANLIGKKRIMVASDCIALQALLGQAEAGNIIILSEDNQNHDYLEYGFVQSIALKAEFKFFISSVKRAPAAAKRASTPLTPKKPKKSRYEVGDIGLDQKDEYDHTFASPKQYSASKRERTARFDDRRVAF